MRGNGACATGPLPDGPSTKQSTPLCAIFTQHSQWARATEHSYPVLNHWHVHLIVLRITDRRGVGSSNTTVRSIVAPSSREGRASLSSSPGDSSVRLCVSSEFGFEAARAQASGWRVASEALGPRHRAHTTSSARHNPGQATTWCYLVVGDIVATILPLVGLNTHHPTSGSRPSSACPAAENATPPAVAKLPLMPTGAMGETFRSCRRTCRR